MDALFGFITAVLIALAAAAFSQFGVAAEGLELRAPTPKAERSVKRSPIAPVERHRPKTPA